VTVFTLVAYIPWRIS